MSGMDIVNHTKEVLDYFPASVPVSTVNGAGVDCTGHRFAVSKVRVGTMSGTNTIDYNIAVKTGASTWTDITGAVSAQFTDALEEDIHIGLIDLTMVSGSYGGQVILRHEITVGGTGAVVLDASFELAGASDLTESYGSANNPRRFEVIADGS